MPTNNRVALQPYWDNLIWQWPTRTCSAPKSPWAARATVPKFNTEAMGRALKLKAQGVAKEVQISSMRRHLTENSAKVGLDNLLSIETADAVLAASQTRSRDVEEHTHSNLVASLNLKLHHTANSGAISQGITEVQSASLLEDTCGRESAAK
jgi:hypothetical protein